MTPSARIAAAIAVLDARAAGQPAEQALINWARASRFAGSGDRAAVRDHVFGVIRRLRSCAALGGGANGRALMLGALRDDGIDPAPLFDGARHHPAPLTEAERAHLARAPDLPELVALDCPDWLAPALRADLGAGFAPVMAALRHRAPVFLRVNTARTTRAEARVALAAEGIGAEFMHHINTALRVTENERKVAGSHAFRSGLVEVQDAASQAVVAALPDLAGARVLDYCAGGGGKALAMAAAGACVFAHDAAPARMVDLPRRAERAGARIATLTTPTAQAPFDGVLADMPCSGSGAWRRSPEGKWRLTPDSLAALCTTQAGILDATARLVAPGGWLGAATCSVLRAENDAQIDGFLARHPDWHCAGRHRWLPGPDGDGFFLALLRAPAAGSERR